VGRKRRGIRVKNKEPGHQIQADGEYTRNGTIQRRKPTSVSLNPRRRKRVRCRAWDYRKKNNARGLGGRNFIRKDLPLQLGEEFGIDTAQERDGKKKRRLHKKLIAPGGGKQTSEERKSSREQVRCFFRIAQLEKRGH